MFVVMTERHRQIHHRRPTVRFGHNADVIPLYRLYEAFCYSVTFRTPLLLWHGLDDDVVPADESLRLQQALSETERDKLLTCSWQPGVRHRITPEALDAAVTFFRQHL